MAQLMYHAGNTTEACSYYDQIISLNPTDADASMVYGNQILLMH